MRRWVALPFCWLRGRLRVCSPSSFFCEWPHYMFATPCSCYHTSSAMSCRNIYTCTKYVYILFIPSHTTFSLQPFLPLTFSLYNHIIHRLYCLSLPFPRVFLSPGLLYALPTDAKRGATSPRGSAFFGYIGTHHQKATVIKTLLQGGETTQRYVILVHMP